MQLVAHLGSHSLVSRLLSSRGWELTQQCTFVNINNCSIMPHFEQSESPGWEKTECQEFKFFNNKLKRELEGMKNVHNFFYKPFLQSNRVLPHEWWRLVLPAKSEMSYTTQGVIEKIIFRFLKFWLLCNRSVKAFDIRKLYLTALMQSFLFKPLLWINGFKINLSFRFYFDCMFIANELTVSIKRVILIRKRKLCFLKKDWKLEGY